MIESQALYVLIVALILLFANPLASLANAATAHGGLAFWLLIGSSAAAALTVAVGTMLSSFGQGRVTGAALDAIAEQPGRPGTDLDGAVHQPGVAGVAGALRADHLADRAVRQPGR